MTINIVNIAKNSLKISAVQTLGAAVALFASMYVATIVLPEQYGIYGFLLLWLTYAGLVNPGIANAGNREMPGLLGKSKTDAAVRVQNVSLSPEMVWSLVPFAVILVSAFFFTDYTYRVGLIIIAFSFLSYRLTNFWGTYNYTRERFNTVAVGYLIQGVGVPVLTLLLVVWLKVYALLLAPLAVNVGLWIYYLNRGPINFRFQFDWPEIARLFKVGVVLQAGVLALFAYRLMDRTIIAAMLPSDQLGLYTYASSFIMVALAIPTSFTSVLQPILWRHAENAKNIVEGFRDAKRIAVYLALATAMLIPLAQVAYYIIMHLVTVNYLPSVPAFNVLSYNICLMAIALIPSLVLNSAIVNKQKTLLVIYIIGLAINVALNILVIRLDYGIVGVAWVMVGSQLLISLAMYYFSRRYMFSGAGEYLKLQGKILLPLIVALGFFFLHRYLDTHFGMRGYAGISLAAQAAAWILVLVICYRDYVSMREIKGLVENIKGDINSARQRK